MEQERGNLVSPSTEVPVVEGELVTAIRRLADCGWGTKASRRARGAQEISCLETELAKKTTVGAGRRDTFIRFGPAWTPCRSRTAAT
jgi:hypothetical protein